MRSSHSWSCAYVVSGTSTFSQRTLYESRTLNSVILVIHLYMCRAYDNSYSAYGKRLLHKVDVKLERCSLCHETGVTGRYSVDAYRLLLLRFKFHFRTKLTAISFKFNVIMDFPVTIVVNQLLRGGPRVALLLLQLLLNNDDNRTDRDIFSMEKYSFRYMTSVSINRSLIYGSQMLCAVWSNLTRKAMRGLVSYLDMATLIQSVGSKWSRVAYSISSIVSKMLKR